LHGNENAENLGVLFPQVYLYIVDNVISGGESELCCLFLIKARRAAIPRRRRRF